MYLFRSPQRISVDSEVLRESQLTSKVLRRFQIFGSEVLRESQLTSKVLRGTLESRMNKLGFDKMTTIISTEQIEEICDNIPQSYPQIKLYDVAMDNIKNNIRMQLKGKELADHPQAFEELKERIYETLVLARVKNESFKGMEAAHVLGNISSQTMLHAKRGQGGQNQYVSTFDTIKNYVRFSKEMEESIVTVTLHATEESDADIYRRYIPQFTETTLASVVDSYEFVTENSDTNMLGLRLYLNKNMMYERKISAGSIHDTLMAMDDSNYLIIPATSSYVGYMDIYVDVESSSFMDHSMFDRRTIENDMDAVTLFLTNVIIDNMKDIILGGVIGGDYVALVHDSLGPYMLEESIITMGSRSGWMILWDQTTARNKGILFEHVQDVFNVLGVEPFMLDSVPNRFFIFGWPHVSSPLSMIKSIEIGEYIGHSMRLPDGDIVVTYEMTKVTHDDIRKTFVGMFGGDIEIDFEIERGSNEPTNQFILRGVHEDFDPVTYLRELYEELNIATRIRILQIYTNNIIGILDNTQIDPRTITSNNPRVIVSMFGIEALRYMMIANMALLMFDSGKEFNVRHLEVIVDHMTMHGYVTPISSLGMEGHRLGPLTEASYMAGDQILAKAALFGRRDEMNTISSHIMTGRRGNYGTDYARSKNIEIAGTPQEQSIFRNYEDLTVSQI